MTEAASVQPSFEIRRVAIIGAGVAGRSFALACAGAGFHVVLEDVMPANLRKAEADYADLTERGTAGRLELASTVEDAVREADVAVDFVPDELESKLEIFSMIDRMAPPKTILCTPSYALSITDLASCVYRPDRCVAVRGNLSSDLIGGDASEPPAVRLLYPASATESTLTAVDKFLQALGVAVQRETDPEVPLLTRNVLM
jgi:3-hydroxybutyryl-CoA dehydrogenase